MNTLRGVSALIVAFVHAFQIFCLPMIGLYTFPHLFTSCLATYSVVIFFIVSGFMIYASVQNHSDERGFDAGSFFKARLLRIYPPLLASVGLCVLIFYLVNVFKIHGHDSFRLGDELFVSRENMALEYDRLFSTFFLMYNIFPGSQPAISMNGPLWTLSYEWWFYLFIMTWIQACSTPKISCRYFQSYFLSHCSFFLLVDNCCGFFLAFGDRGTAWDTYTIEKSWHNSITGYKIWFLDRRREPQQRDAGVATAAALGVGVDV